MNFLFLFLFFQENAIDILGYLITLKVDKDVKNVNCLIRRGDFESPRLEIRSRAGITYIYFKDTCSSYIYQVLLFKSLSGGEIDFYIIPSHLQLIVVIEFIRS